MADERLRQQWHHTASLMALMANLHRDPKKSKIFKSIDFHPYAHSKTLERQSADISVLKQVFVSEEP